MPSNCSIDSNTNLGKHLLPKPTKTAFLTRSNFYNFCLSNTNDTLIWSAKPCSYSVKSVTDELQFLNSMEMIDFWIFLALYLVLQNVCQRTETLLRAPKFFHWRLLCCRLKTQAQHKLQHILFPALHDALHLYIYGFRCFRHHLSRQTVHKGNADVTSIICSFVYCCSLSSLDHLINRLDLGRRCSAAASQRQKYVPSWWQILLEGPVPHSLSRDLY